MKERELITFLQLTLVTNTNTTLQQELDQVRAALVQADEQLKLANSQVEEMKTELKLSDSDLRGYVRDKDIYLKYFTFPVHQKLEKIWAFVFRCYVQYVYLSLSQEN